jgi:hypothetical protein
MTEFLDMTSRYGRAGTLEIKPFTRGRRERPVSRAVVLIKKWTYPVNQSF